MNIATQPFRTLGLAFAIALGSLAVPARASESEEALALVEKAQATVEDFKQGKNFAGLSAELAQAHAVLVFPNVLKAGFVLGGSGGSGVLLVRDPASKRWTGPAFYTMGEASLGFQAGASAAKVVMVVRSQKALESLYKNKLKLGADASVAIGPKGIGKGGAIGSDFVTYAKVKGGYAGLAVDGAVLDVRQSLNAAYYGKPVTPVDILVTKSVENPRSDMLRASLAGWAEQSAK